MSFQQLLDEVVNSDADLGSVLRRCKVLATDLGSQQLEDWLIFESNGYVNVHADNLPDYRKWDLQMVGTFAGYGGSMIKNATIPANVIPEEFRPILNFYCRESISSITTILQDNINKTLYISLQEIAGVIGMRYYRGMNCVELRGGFNSGHYVEVLNSVRNRILDFLLSLKKTYPGIETNNIKSSNVESGKVTQIFQTTISHANFSGGIGESQMGDVYKAGQVGAMGPGSHAHDMSFQQIWNQSSNKIDLPSLAIELSKLRTALDTEATTPEHQLAIGNIAAAQQSASAGDGPKTLQYLKNAGNWALDIAQKIGIGLAVAAIKESFT